MINLIIDFCTVILIAVVKFEEYEKYLFND